ncbi:hypothetical protein [Mucilaginibacter terrenus]|uniref:hypothetical protein n=1 Tax=Mucilaginibacter terrenus TaxID=2482727 RepID=UPI0014036D2E|nr:hypothetical protein [Mucilaginibacter terrenus]
MKKNQNLFVIGLGIGIAMGVALHNVAVGTALGAGIGLALSGEANCSKGLFSRFKRS